MSNQTSTAKHTPSPWMQRAEEIYAHVDGADYAICEVVMPTDEIHPSVHAELEANGHLIKAAPELLEQGLQTMLDLNTAVDNMAHWTPQQLRAHLFAMQGNQHKVNEKARGRATFQSVAEQAAAILSEVSQ